MFACGSSSSDRFAACDVTEQFVRDRLVAPATADFQPCRDRDVTQTGDRWRLQGYVDSENGFGAKLRSTFDAIVEHQEGDRWRLISLQIE